MVVTGVVLTGVVVTGVVVTGMVVTGVVVRCHKLSGRIFIGNAIQQIITTLPLITS